MSDLRTEAQVLADLAVADEDQAQALVAELDDIRAKAQDHRLTEASVCGWIPIPPLSAPSR